MFFSAASIAGAFSGLLAFAIAKLDGLGGLEGWRWIFILEGLATVSKSLSFPPPLSNPRKLIYPHHGTPSLKHHLI